MHSLSVGNEPEFVDETGDSGIQDSRRSGRPSIWKALHKISGTDFCSSFQRKHCITPLIAEGDFLAPLTVEENENSR